MRNLPPLRAKLLKNNIVKSHEKSVKLWGTHGRCWYDWYDKTENRSSNANRKKI